MSEAGKSDTSKPSCTTKTEEEKKQEAQCDKTEQGAAATSGGKQDDVAEQIDKLQQLMQEKLELGEEDEAKPRQVLPDLSLGGIASYISSGNCKKIITMAGAGISTSAGIPDFRSPGSGLYDNLQKYDLPAPEAMFDIKFFKENPEPFFDLARELWPGTFKPTPCHYFLRLLHEKGLLVRHYTQNIDTLELIAGLPEEKVVEAHGSFAHAHCVQCAIEYTKAWMKEKIMAGGVPKCDKEECGGTVKPDIVFFGERLPTRFFQCAQEDFEECDLLIVMGTSLIVQPFASLTGRVKQECPRAYFNRDPPPESNPFMMMLGMGHDFAFKDENNYRDVFCQGTCDDMCTNLAEAVGWKEELEKLVKTEHAKIDRETSTTTTANETTKQSKKGKPADDSQKSPL